MQICEAEVEVACVMGRNVAVDHDKVGETFLHSLGFPASVTQFVRGHVQVRHCIMTRNRRNT